MPQLPTGTAAAGTVRTCRDAPHPGHDRRGWRSSTIKIYRIRRPWSMGHALAARASASTGRTQSTGGTVLLNDRRESARNSSTFAMLLTSSVTWGWRTVTIGGRSGLEFLVRGALEFGEPGVRGPDELVFTGPAGGVMRNNNWRRRVFDPGALRVGLEGLMPPELRHTAASLAVSAGANVKAVQQMLGHASAARTVDAHAPDRFCQGCRSQCARFVATPGAETVSPSFAPGPCGRPMPGEAPNGPLHPPDR